MITTISQDFSKDWHTAKSGSGTVTHPGNGVVRTTGTIGNAAYVAFETIAMPGEIVVFSVFGRGIAADGVTYPQIFLDAPNGTNKTKVNIVSTNWELYKVSYQIPFTVTNPVLVKIGVGNYSTIGGTAEFYRPTLEIRNEVLGASRVIASGLISVSSGGSAVSVNVSYKNHGFGTLGYTAANKQIDMTLGYTYDFSGLQTSRPSVYLQPLSDGDATDGLLIWKPTSISDDGSFKIEAYLATTGAKYNFADSTVTHYCFVNVII